MRALSKFDDALDLPAEFAALRDSGARPRRPMPMADLKAAVKEHANDKLAKLGEPKMSTEEALDSNPDRPEPESLYSAPHHLAG